MSYLLDVNFLVALFDPRHVNHESAHTWFSARGARRWATCSITEGGCIRVLANPSYPTVTATPAEVIGRLRRFCAAGGHSFWRDDVSLRTSLDGAVTARLQGYRQVTDFHLAALALQCGGHLVTFDGRLQRALAGTALAPAVVLVEKRRNAPG